MRKFAAVIITVIAFLIFPMSAFAISEGIDEIYSEQLEASGADRLADSLPEETADYIGQVGASPEPAEISFSKIIFVITDIIKGSAAEVFGAFGCTAALIIISALIGGITDGMRSPSMSRTASAAAGAAICVLTASPAAGFITDAAEAAENCCRFDEVLIPVYSLLTASSGDVSSAAGYSVTMPAVLGAATVLISEAVLPVLRIILAVSLVSSLSPSLKLGSAVKLLEKYLKWALGFISALTVGVFGISNFCASTADGAASRAAKYVVSSAVPVLGSAMGEALSSVTGCVRMLRASVGAFGMTAMAFILIPPLVRGALWQLELNLCALLSDALGVKSIKELTGAVGSVVSIMTAVIVFTAVLTIFTLAATFGGGGAA